MLPGNCVKLVKSSGNISVVPKNQWLKSKILHRLRLNFYYLLITIKYVSIYHSYLYSSLQLFTRNNQDYKVWVSRRISCCVLCLCDLLHLNLLSQLVSDLLADKLISRNVEMNFFTICNKQGHMSLIEPWIVNMELNNVMSWNYVSIA